MHIHGLSLLGYCQCARWFGSRRGGPAGWNVWAGACDAIKRYNSEGLEGLYDRAKSGRPRHLNARQERELSAIVLAGPDVEKEGISAYTREDLARIVRRKWRVSYHVGSMGRVLRRLGFSRQKARPSHPQKDEAAVAAFKKSPANAEKDCRYT